MKEEFLNAKRLTRMPEINAFSREIYKKVHAQISAAEAVPGLLPGEALAVQGYKRERQHLLNFHRFFAHHLTSGFLAQQSHGSAGLSSPLYYRRLGNESAYYYDSLWTALTNFVYQYQSAVTAEKLHAIGFAAVAELQQQQQQGRVKSTTVPPRVEQLEAPVEEITARFPQFYGDGVAASGEDNYRLENCPYKASAAAMGAPVLTGISVNSYQTFKTLAVLLEMSALEMMQLRRCLLAYMVSAHDHSVIEVLDAINVVLQEEDFRQVFAAKFNTLDLVVPLETAEDYQQACQDCFVLSLASPLCAIQHEAKALLSSSTESLFLQRIYHRYFTAEITADQRQCVQDRVEELLKWLLQVNNLQTIFAEEKEEKDFTALEPLLDLYVASYCSTTKTVVLGCSEALLSGEFSSLTVEQAQQLLTLCRQFGLAHSRHGAGLAVDKLAARAKKPEYAADYDLLPLATAQQYLPARRAVNLLPGNGAIYCPKRSTPLMHAIWLLACIDAGKTVQLYAGLVRENAMTDNLLMQLWVLQRHKYEPAPLEKPLHTLLAMRQLVFSGDKDDANFSIKLFFKKLARFQCLPKEQKCDLAKELLQQFSGNLNTCRMRK